MSTDLETQLENLTIVGPVIQEQRDPAEDIVSPSPEQVVITHTAQIIDDGSDPESLSAKAPKDRADQPELTFHPEFATPPPGSKKGDIIILRSSDETCFYSSLSELAQRSSFFAALVSLPGSAEFPAAAEGEEQHHLIDLPSATPRGLAFVLTAISTSWHDALEPLQVAEGETKGVIGPVMSEVFTITDAYDITGVWPLNSLFWMALGGQDAFLLFALSAVTLSEGGARPSVAPSHISMMVEGLLSREMSEMSAPARDILQKGNPAYLRRLEEYHSRQQTRKATYLRSLESEEPMMNGFMDFGMRCKGLLWPHRDNSDRPVDTCRAFDKFDRDFDKMRRTMANRVCDMVLGGSKVSAEQWSRSNFRSDIRQHIGCGPCATRLSWTFENATRSLSEVVDAYNADAF